MNLRLELSEHNPNTLSNIEEAFARGGAWDRNCGQTQTHLFAKCFHKHIKVSFTGKFTVLDVGCALGDALLIWHRHYPKAEMFGCDVSETAIARATELYSSIAKFTRASFEEIKGFYDVIFCSNVLEHFEQHVEIARELLTHCKVLYVMTPFAELNNGRPLVPSPQSFHVASFFEDTFSSLEKECNATVKTKVVRCPVAWSPSFKSEVMWHMKYLMGLISSPSSPRRQIIYTITR